MRVLFIHAAREDLSPEYKVHVEFAESARRHGVESFFLWQRSSAGVELPPAAGHAHYFDFGRDMSLDPRPQRWQRALMMLKGFAGTFPAVASLVRQIRPDLLYTSQQGIDMRLALALRRVVRVPHLIHLHYTVGPWWDRHALHVVRQSRNLLAVSEFIRETALLHGVGPERVRTLPNPISPSRFGVPTQDDRAALRGVFGWPEAARVVLSAGRLDPGKGHSLLIDAFREVTARVPGTKLLICGASTQRDDYAASLSRRVAELGLEEHVTFAGHRRDLAQLLRGADVFCLPTELEPFGLVFLEAMAAGLPVVACTSGAVHEIVIHSVTGLLSYPGDVSALARNLGAVLSNPDLAHQLGERGRERARNEFDVDRAAKRWAAELELAVARG